MLDVATFLSTLYVLADEYVEAALPPDPPPGPAAALSRSEVLTLASVGQWRRFESERAFYRSARSATRHWRACFPTLPRRSQCNRWLRRHRAARAAFGLAVAQRPAVRTGRDGLYEALDGTAAPVRPSGRRGHGWLAGPADQGWSTHLGWYWGLRVLATGTPGGASTGFGVGPASANERPLAAACFATRQGVRLPPGTPPPPPRPPVPWGGQPAGGATTAAAGAPEVFSATDTGVEGADAHARWAALYGVRVICPPKRSAAPRRPGSRPKQQWPGRWRRWLAGLRPIVATGFATLQPPCRLLDERPHDLTGFLARLAANLALHNCCLSLHCTLGRAARLCPPHRLALNLAPPQLTPNVAAPLRWEGHRQRP